MVPLMERHVVPATNLNVCQAPYSDFAICIVRRRHKKISGPNSRFQKLRSSRLVMILNLSRYSKICAEKARKEMTSVGCVTRSMLWLSHMPTLISYVIALFPELSRSGPNPIASKLCTAILLRSCTRQVLMLRLRTYSKDCLVRVRT